MFLPLAAWWHQLAKHKFAAAQPHGFGDDGREVDLFGGSDQDSSVRRGGVLVAVHKVRGVDKPFLSGGGETTSRVEIQKIVIGDLGIHRPLENLFGPCVNPLTRARAIEFATFEKQSFVKANFPYFDKRCLPDRTQGQRPRRK